MHRRTASAFAGDRPLMVDIHCHLGVPDADAIVQTRHPGPPPGIGDLACPLTIETNRRLFQVIGSCLYGIDERLADMERLGVDVQVLSPNPVQYHYHADPDVGRTASRAINDGIATAVAAHPDRFLGMGTVPLQNARLAVDEMRRCVGELGLRAIEIGSHVNGRDLHLEEFRPFLSAAEELDVPLFLHPLASTHAGRMREFYLNNLLGNSFESALAVAHLIFAGVFDALPRLRLCVVHGRGFLGSYWGRLDHGWRMREDCRAGCKRPPSHYLRQLWFDTLMFDPVELDALVRAHGAERLCLGSDYPFDMGEPDLVGFLTGLEEEDRRRMLGANALALLGGMPRSEQWGPA